MYLAHLDITKLVTDDMILYLKENTFSFNDYKNLIISKTPIGSILAKNIKDIQTEKDQELRKIKNRLKKEAYNTQLTEDEHEAKEDAKSKINLRKEETDIHQNIELNEQAICRYVKLSALTLADCAKPNLKLTQKQIEEKKALVLEYDLKKLFHAQQIKALNDKLSILQVKYEGIKARHNERYARKLARIGYMLSTKKVGKTLSIDNNKLLKKNIADHKTEIEKKAKSYIDDCQRLNYPIFLEQLKETLDKTKLSLLEKKALSKLIHTIKLHREADINATTLASSLGLKKQSMNRRSDKLIKLQSKRDFLKEQNPRISQTNLELFEKLKILKPEYERNQLIYQNLLLPLKIVTVALLVSLIPLLCTLIGWIPLFTAPALVYTLFATPPGLLAIAEICLGISALVFHIKAKNIDQDIKTQEQLATDNSNQLKRNSTEIGFIKDQSIPAIEKQLEKDNLDKDQLEQKLQEQITLAMNYLEKAKQIEPTSDLSPPNSPTFFKSESEHSREEEEEEEDVEAENQELGSADISLA